MKVLVIGGGGREHALAWKAAQSASVDKVYCVPGNPGIAQIAECVPMDICDNDALTAFALENKIDLTIVGPEVPLANGVVDAFRAKGLAIFGPTQAAAQIEGSKSFAKDLMKKYGVPTAAFEVFTEAEAAKAYIVEQGAPIVIKADGLAAGKGVVVAMTLDEALAAVDMMMCDHAFGTAGCQVVVEEFLTGEEASILTFCDGNTIVPMISSQDHKRAYDNDEGPNTGGMGTYAPAPVVTADILARVQKEILEPTVAAMKAEGIPYTGCLYAGLMITENGPKVIEFNARFGDPETQVVLPLLDSDMAEIMMACVNGTLADLDIKWKDEAAVCVVMAAGGYPQGYRKGDVISGLDEAAQQGAIVFHAGTASKDGSIVTNGGRVLGVTAVGSDIQKAVDNAYQAVKTIHFDDVHYRNDIAYRAIARLK
ncbi:MAG: phosphoribosylamine--glycine ligase [Selenomonadales bacterium]|nr:phosphoribosylamine--glycine ligase [Selenomonadales bacterium]